MMLRTSPALEHQITELQAMVQQLLPWHPESARNLFDALSTRLLAEAPTDAANYAAFRLMEVERALFDGESGAR